MKRPTWDTTSPDLHHPCSNWVVVKEVNLGYHVGGMIKGLGFRAMCSPRHPHREGPPFISGFIIS